MTRRSSGDRRPARLLTAVVLPFVLVGLGVSALWRRSAAFVSAWAMRAATSIRWIVRGSVAGLRRLGKLADGALRQVMRPVAVLATTVLRLVWRAVQLVLVGADLALAVSDWSAAVARAAVARLHSFAALVLGAARSSVRRIVGLVGRLRIALAPIRHRAVALLRAVGRAVARIALSARIVLSTFLRMVARATLRLVRQIGRPVRLGMAVLASLGARLLALLRVVGAWAAMALRTVARLVARAARLGRLVVTAAARVTLKVRSLGERVLVRLVAAVRDLIRALRPIVRMVSGVLDRIARSITFLAGRATRVLRAVTRTVAGGMRTALRVARQAIDRAGARLDRAIDVAAIAIVGLAERGWRIGKRAVHRARGWMLRVADALSAGLRLLTIVVVRWTRESVRAAAAVIHATIAPVRAAARRCATTVAAVAREMRHHIGGVIRASWWPARAAVRASVRSVVTGVRIAIADARASVLASLLGRRGPSRPS